MSIRLRLTLLYTSILALTLIAFSTIIYVIQNQVTLEAMQTTLRRNAQAFNLPDRRFPPRGETVPPIDLVRGRWTQIRNADGSIASRTPDLGDTTLPLSDAGLRSVRDGKAWFESAQVDNEPLLIYSQPILQQDRLTRIVQVALPLSEREQSLNTLGLIFAVGDGLVIIATFAIGWWLAGMSLRPIHQITQTAQTIGVERDFSRRVDYVGPNDEVGQLATTFNAMLTELESAFGQLKQSLNVQRRFVADASHELRTPLTTVRGNIELLSHIETLESNERAEILADTKSEVERLIRLVHQLLTLARMDAGKPLKIEPLSIAPVLDEACRQAKIIAPAKSIQCAETANVVILGNHDALKQVLLILLDNALVHTPPDTRVSLSSQVMERTVAIYIRDTGSGISPEVLPHLFERFYRGDESRSGDGTGLGLAIAKELVNAQKGTLGVASEIGKGTTFTITLPRE